MGLWDLGMRGDFGERDRCGEKGGFWRGRSRGEVHERSKDELSGQIFDDELDLAYAVIDGVTARGEKGNYSTQRVKFNSNAYG